jgi:hypothetical protein
MGARDIRLYPRERKVSENSCKSPGAAEGNRLLAIPSAFLMENSIRSQRRLLRMQGEEHYQPMTG